MSSDHSEKANLQFKQTDQQTTVFGSDNDSSEFSMNYSRDLDTSTPSEAFSYTSSDLGLLNSIGTESIVVSIVLNTIIDIIHLGADDLRTMFDDRQTNEAVNRVSESVSLETPTSERKRQTLISSFI